MPIKNNATRLLDSRKIHYEIFEYDASHFHAAAEVAQLIGVAVNQVYKTIVVLRENVVGTSRRSPLLVMVAADKEIDLKRVAASLGEKKLKVAKHDEAEALTGLQVGGISALALLTKPFEPCIDRPALELSHVYVSAGQRGLNVKIGVQALIQLTNAKIVDAT
jgi:Cys-tRNA(Pro)/Cys-tRNA(Cys) deacylase